MTDSEKQQTVKDFIKIIRCTYSSIKTFLPDPDQPHRPFNVPDLVLLNYHPFAPNGLIIHPVFIEKQYESFNREGFPNVIFAEDTATLLAEIKSQCEKILPIVE